VRGPFTRWPRASDTILAVSVFVAALISVTASGLDDRASFTTAALADHPTGVFVLLGLGSAALWWRRTAPIAVTAFVLGVMIVWALAGYGDGNDLPLVVAVYSVGRYSDDLRHSLATATVAAAVSVLCTIIDADQHIDVLPAIVVAVLPWYVGRRVRNRGDYLALLRERAERLEAEQHAHAERAVAAERARIARELHDEVAHQVSMMTVQAGAAKTIARDDLDTAIEAMGDVERAGRQALGELRQLLGVLRHDDADPDHLGPRPGLADLPELADELAHTGAVVTFTMADLPDRRSSALELSAYRIVQESFTNIIKHAGSEPVVAATVAVDRDALDIEIVNTTGSATPGLPASGYGVAGMHERAALLGGTLSVGPLPPDRYRVHARLPLDPEPA
jgi:signal transduction histidine kinase